MHAKEIGMNLIIRTVNGKTLNLDVNPSDSIEAVKKLVAAQLGDKSSEELRTIFAGKQLEDGHTLNDYNIQHGSTINVAFIVRAPGP
jgi:hypothetical protein